MLPFLGLLMTEMLPKWRLIVKEEHKFDHKSYDDTQLEEVVVELSLSKWELKQLAGSIRSTRRRCTKNLNKINERLLEGNYATEDIPKYEQIAKSQVWKAKNLLKLENKLLSKALKLGYSLSWIKDEEVKRETISS